MQQPLNFSKESFRSHNKISPGETTTVYQTYLQNVLRKDLTPPFVPPLAEDMNFVDGRTFFKDYPPFSRSSSCTHHHRPHNSQFSADHSGPVIDMLAVLGTRSKEKYGFFAGNRRSFSQLS
eukprot:g290.t1